MPLRLGGRALCPHCGFAQQGPQEPGWGEEPERAPGDPLGPCEGPRACTGGSPSATGALLHCGRSAPCATPGARGPIPGPEEEKPQSLPPRAEGWGSP